MALLFLSDVDPPDWWRQELARLMPALEVRVWPEIGAPADIEFALVWRPPAGLLASLPNLKAIFSLGAGVDHLFADSELPKDVPITRVVDENLTRQMTEYVLLHVLRHHRRHETYLRQQAGRVWAEHSQPAAADRRVGVMGQGVLGADAARSLAGLGFRVAGLSRRPKALPGIESFHGADALLPFAARSEILVNMLPLTPALENVLDHRLFAALPEGAVVINVGRGAHLVEGDLIAALDSGHLAGATLDVFRVEPLPHGHPFWRHPKVTVTPHIASVADPRTVARTVVDNIARARAGRPLRDLVDPAVGY